MEEINLKLTLSEINLIIEALGTLPFARVHEVIGSIQRQGSQQLRNLDENQGSSITTQGAAKPPKDKR